jgi:hypothetical protein
MTDYEYFKELFDRLDKIINTKEKEVDKMFIVTYVVNDKMDRKNFCSINNLLLFIFPLLLKEEVVEIMIQNYCGEMIYKWKKEI